MKIYTISYNFEQFVVWNKTFYQMPNEKSNKLILTQYDKFQMSIQKIMENEYSLPSLALAITLLIIMIKACKFIESVSNHFSHGVYLPNMFIPLTILRT